MLVVKRISQTAGPLPDLDGRCFVSEKVMLRITRSGFALGYLPAQRPFWHSCPPSTTALTLLLPDPQAEGTLIAAYEDGTMIGLAAVTVHNTGWAVLEDIRVDVPHRRKGAGTMLMDACQRYALETGMYGLSVTTSDLNPALCQFLERNSFQLGGVDRLALAMTDSERVKPMLRRACQLTFYRLNEKG